MTSVNDFLHMDEREFRHTAGYWVQKVVALTDESAMESVIARLPRRQAEAVRRDVANAWRKYVKTLTSCRAINIERARDVRDSKLISAVSGALELVWNTQAPAAFEIEGEVSA